MVVYDMARSVRQDVKGVDLPSHSSSKLHFGCEGNYHCIAPVTRNTVPRGFWVGVEVSPVVSDLGVLYLYI